MTQTLDDLLEFVRTADVVDAMGRLHAHRAHILDLVSPTPERTLFGPAITVSYFPTCEQLRPAEGYNFARIFYEAAADEPEGKVLVLASNGHPDTSMGGGTKLSRVENLGLAGVLADGRLRDFEQLAGYHFTTFCRGEATRWGGDVITPFQANVPVVIEGVGIMPGDYVYADSSGAVVMPRHQVREVLEEAAGIAREDRDFVETIREEDPHSPPWDER